MSVHQDSKEELFSESLNNYIGVLITKLEKYLQTSSLDVSTVKKNFESVLVFIDSSELTPVKSSSKLKIILNELLKYGKLGLVPANDSSTLLELCKILLRLINNDDFIETVNGFIELVLVDFTPQTARKTIKHDINLFTFYAIDSFLKTVKAKNIQCNSFARLEKIFIGAILCSDNDVLCVVLHYIIPNFISYCNSNKILEEIWLSLQNASNKTDIQKCHDEQSLSKVITVLCMLAQYYISLEKNSFSLVTEEQFWYIIYSGLTDPLAFHRKKALYLLKRSVDFLEVNSLSFKCSYFVWNDNQVSHLKEIWKDIIIVLEVLEEKQLHLITPILPSVVKLSVINSVIGEELLKDIWLTCLCQRLMSHESSQVVKWGIVNLICADAFFRLEYNPNFYRIIFKSLNNTSLYAKSQVSDSFAVDKALENWFLKFSYHPDGTFLKNVLDVFCDISWAPVPLFYVVQALAAIPKTACWDGSVLRTLKKFIIETLGTQNIHIRGAIQCCLLRCVINLTDTKDLDYRTVFDLISVFRSSECLKRGTLSWKMLVIWLKEFIEPPKVLAFLSIEFDGILQNTNSACLPVEAVSRCVILLSDCGLFGGESKASQIFTPILNLFNHTCHSNSNSLDRALIFLMNLVLELESVGTSDGNDATRELVFCLALKCMRSAMSYIEMGFKNWFGFTNDISAIQQYLAFISCFGSCESTKSEMKESILKLVIDSYNVLSDSKSSNTTLKYFSLMLVSWVAEYNCSQYKECSSVSSNGIIAKNHKSFVENMVKEQQINTVFQGEGSKPCYDSKMLSSCVLAGWKLLHSYLEAFDTSVSQIKSLIKIDQLIDLGLEATQIGGKDVLAEVNRVFEILLPEYINELETETLSKFITTTWKACFELRKNELFWIIFKSWIKMFYQNRLLKDEKCNTLQIEYANNILELGETVGGLSNCLFKHLNEDIDTPEALNKLPNDLLVKALVFGPVHRKDLRIESEVCNFIKSKGGDYSINILKPLTGDRDDCEVRLYVLNMILNVCSGKNGEIAAPRTLISVMESLIEEDSRISEKKKRYYGDSYHHRVKNRIVQVLLVLEHVLFKSESSSSSEVFYEKLLDWLSDNLSRESHQPSIRYQLQWLFVRCLLHKPSHLPKFWIMFEKGSEERAGCVCSYISIAYHLAAVLKNDEFSSRCVQEILPWCMAQHFNVRMYAQFVLSKLWSINEASGWGEEHRVVRTSLVRSLSKGSAIKNLPKLECDFYFSNFHPMKHFSLKSIFIELPRLSSVTRDEWCSEMVLENCLHSSRDLIDLDDPITASDAIKSLADCEPATWTFKTRESAECASETDIIQKKFVPWRDMLADEESNIPSDQKREREGLIVVASLIDRPPNLGGLSRTCEVFGVSELVLNSLHYLTDKQFTSLSMSSEKHVNITEVKEYHMADYIQKMKRAGYTIVGAEQTPASVQLTQFKFPCNTVLILGNEKEGIPANMLPLLDACIVVPQYGLVRSLNVHVTGALFIWEYAKQYK